MSNSVLRCVDLLGNSNFPGFALRQAIGEYRQNQKGTPMRHSIDNIGNKQNLHQKRKPLSVVLHWSSTHRLRNQRSTRTGDSMQSIGNVPQQ